MPPDMHRASTRLFWSGLLLILSGSLLAYLVQGAGGIRVHDVRFAGTGAAIMGALLYVPPNATPKTPAPGVLAVHGYFNSREAQDGFAIELARRGYVVLALDQTGHGRSAPPAFANEFGGPDGLRYLRSLDVVDKDNIGLEGHSMGGWTVMHAAAAFPDGYKAIVLEGSSTGAPFAPEGSPTFPRNLAVIFSRLDEFPQIMWGVPTAKQVTQSAKLQHVFASFDPVRPGRVYGSIAGGTARILYTPGGTHPMDHISPAAIGASLEWFQHTLRGGTPRPPSDQIWYWKEAGTLVALIGCVLLLLGAFDVLRSGPYFAPLVTLASATPDARAGGRRPPASVALLVAALLPALTLIPFCELGHQFLPATSWHPQAFTNEVVVWIILQALVVTALAGGRRARVRLSAVHVRRSLTVAMLTVGIGFVAAAGADYFFKVDFRIWFVALKVMSHPQLWAFLLYVVPFTLYFVLVLPVLHAQSGEHAASASGQYLFNIAMLTGGPVLYLLVQYGTLLTTNHLITFFTNDPLRTILCIALVPALGTAAVIATFIYRRTNSYLPGALICGLLITWYAVAGTANQAV
jgi:pimeloyl-ACP methyl ester carboxylesterase